MPAVEARSSHLARRIGNLGQLTGCLPDPPVEWAPDAFTLDLPAVSEMGAEVPTVGIEQRRLAVLCPEQYEFPIEVLHRPDVSRSQLRRVTDLEPARGKHFVGPVLHGTLSQRMDDNQPPSWHSAMRAALPSNASRRGPELAGMPGLSPWLRCRSERANLVGPRVLSLAGSTGSKPAAVGACRIIVNYIVGLVRSACG